MPASVSAFGFGFDFFLGNMKQYGLRLQAWRLLRRADLLKMVVPNDGPCSYSAIYRGLGAWKTYDTKMKACRRIV